MSIETATSQTSPRPEHQAALPERASQQRGTAGRCWDDDVRERLSSDGSHLLAAYLELIPESYKQDFTAARAVDDIARLEALGAGSIDVHLDLERSEPRFTLYVADERVSLSKVLP